MNQQEKLTGGIYLFQPAGVKLVICLVPGGGVEPPRDMVPRDFKLSFRGNMGKSFFMFFSFLSIQDYLATIVSCFSF